MARGLRKSGRLQIQLDGKLDELDDESLKLDKLGHVARVKVGIADSGYLRRTDLRTVGTEQSRPPLPNKMPVPFRGPVLFCMGRIQAARKQVQAEAPRCVASDKSAETN
jgi:hypothetical protein